MLPQMSDHAVTAQGARWKHGRVDGWPPALQPGRLWTWAAIVAGFPLLFLCGLRGAGQLSVQSDGAATALQAWAMLHGNLLLHGWVVSDVSFYTTELPEYMLVEAVRGLRPDVVHWCAGLTYALLVLLAALVAYGSCRTWAGLGRRAGLIAVAITVTIMVGPTLSGASVLLDDPDHTGTAVPVLLALLLLDRFHRRRWVPAAVAAVLGLTLAGDSLVLLIAIVPLITVAGARAYWLIWQRRAALRGAWYELSLTAAGLAAWVVGSGLSALLRSLGAFAVNPAPTQYIVAAAKVPANAAAELQDFLILFSGDIFGVRMDRWLDVTAVHLVFALAVAVALALAVRGLARSFRGPAGPARADEPAAATDPDLGRDRRGGADLVAGVLAGGNIMDVLAYGLLYSVSPSTEREIAPVFALGAALAGRALAVPVLRCRLEPLLALAGAAAIAVTVPALVAARPVAAANASLARFLEARGLSSGISAYWQGDSVMVDTADQVRLRAVRYYPGHGLAFYPWETDVALLSPGSNQAGFMVIDKQTTGQGGSLVTAREAVAQFGQPAKVYQYEQYEIMVWHQNLVAQLRLSSVVSG